MTISHFNKYFILLLILSCSCNKSGPQFVSAPTSTLSVTSNLGNGDEESINVKIKVTVLPPFADRHAEIVTAVSDCTATFMREHDRSPTSLDILECEIETGESVEKIKKVCTIIIVP